VSRPPLHQLVNLRDLGGIEVTDGSIRPGLLWRADDVSLVTPEGADALLGLGISTVIDLRSAAEQRRTGPGALTGHPVEHHHLPLLAVSANPIDLQAMVAADGDSPGVVARWYARLVIDRADLIVDALRVIAQAPGGVVFHCAAGKDRTGIVAAAVLSTLGARDATIARDYARTQEAVPVILERIAARMPAWLPPSTDAPSAVLGALEDSMLGMLAELRSTAGGMTAVLVEHGLDDALRQRLREHLVDPSTE
jgi:protein-tyrosine phosphatase